MSWTTLDHAANGTPPTQLLMSVLPFFSRTAAQAEGA
jgi:hypothetical protein